MYHAGDHSGNLFANDSRGKIWLINGSTGATQLFLDLQKARAGALRIAPKARGLRSFAFHPDFARAGRPGHRKLYTVSTESVRSGGTKVFGGPFTVLFHDVVAEWQVHAGNPRLVDPTTRRELLRIAQYGLQHNTDQLMFNPNAAVGSSDYGMMYIGIGDGDNVPRSTDPYNQAQNPGRALGKIFRINPLKQSDGSAYGIPADNPFVRQRGHLPELWALGLRHPQNLSFDAGGSGKFLIADIGQGQIEEINLGVKGANYGWPLREGTFVTDRTDASKLYTLPANDPTKGFTYPVAQYDHDGKAAAVTGGFVYRGSTIPALVGHYLFGDLISGRVFHVPVSELTLGRQAVVRELTFKQRGTAVTLRDLAAGIGASRVDLRFGQDAAGEIYILTKQEGKIRKLAKA